MRRKVAPKKDNAKALAKIGERFRGFRPAAEALTVVRAVPTIFAQFDYAARVGGLPIERITLLHGRSSEGKSLFSLGLVRSFLERDHFAFWIDAERTTPITWVEQLMGEELSRSPRFFATRPDSYEETVKDVREAMVGLMRAREAGEIPEDASAIVVVDSIRKLVPKDLLEKILKDKADKKGAGKDIGGRAGQVKAAMNAQWMDELVPLLEKARAGMVIITRETEDPDADAWARKMGDAYKLTGGKALFFDSSLVIRVERESWVTDKAEHAEGDERRKSEVYGERHRVSIRKTKVAGKDARESVAHFHSSNGKLAPFGFDRARDVLELAEKFDLVRQKGSWLTWANHRWQGRNAAVRKLSSSAELFAELDGAVRAQFAERPPEEWDAETGELDG